MVDIFDSFEVCAYFTFIDFSVGFDQVNLLKSSQYYKAHRLDLSKDKATQWG